MSLKHIDEMEAASYTIDTHCYPHLAYKGFRFAATEYASCYTPLESMLLRERELNAAGFFLRDDRSIREGVEQFKGHEEAYSLHTVRPFERFGVFAGSREWAVCEAHKQIFTCQHLKTVPARRYPLRWGSAETQVCQQCGKFRFNHRGWSNWEFGPIPNLPEEA